MSVQLAERVHAEQAVAVRADAEHAVAEQPADLHTPVTLVVPFTERTMMAVALRLHDDKCHQQRKGVCNLRTIHAHNSFMDDARRHLIALAAAFAAGELS